MDKQAYMFTFVACVSVNIKERNKTIKLAQIISFTELERKNSCGIYGWVGTRIWVNGKMSDGLEISQTRCQDDQNLDNTER